MEFYTNGFAAIKCKAESSGDGEGTMEKHGIREQIEIPGELSKPPDKYSVLRGISTDRIVGG